MKVAWEEFKPTIESEWDYDTASDTGAQINSPGGAFWIVWRHIEGQWYASIGWGGDIEEHKATSLEHGKLICEHHIYQNTLRNVLKAVVEATDGDFCDEVVHAWSCECADQRKHVMRVVGEYINQEASPQPGGS